MIKKRWQEKLKDLKNALDRLEKGLKEEQSNSLVIDGVIQRFEFNYELVWKVLKFYFEYQGLERVNSPRSAFKEAYALGLIENGDDWVDMLTDRNLTSHTYDEQMARKIYRKIRDKHFPNLKEIYHKLRKEKVE